VSSTSAVKVLWRYRQTRLPLRLYLPLLLVLLAAGMAAGGPLTVASGVARALLACTLLVQFRLWDDLSDIEKDRRDHPERVLVRAPSLGPFGGLLWAAFVGSLVLLALCGDLLRLAAFLALNAAFLAWYGGVRHVLPSAVLGYHVVLLKYPVFVFLLSGMPCRPGLLLVAAAGVYLGLCVYEVLHDRRLWGLPQARLALTVEAVALLLVAAVLIPVPDFLKMLFLEHAP
jgi:hypothetical protein